MRPPPLFARPVAPPARVCARTRARVCVCVLSESTSHKTLQLLGDLVDTTAIPTRELEVVPKSFDDSSLRPPDTAIGERPCCLAERCVCVWMARWRYGDETEMAFIGTEFLLPSERAAFDLSGASALPTTPGKCLVCSRYLHTYIYRQARSNPAFRPSASLPLQAYGNPLGVVKGAGMPTHASSICGADGYRQDAMLFVDEAWADTAAARGEMSTFLWRPCVKFLATHYKYVKDPAGLPRLLQRGVGSDPETVAHFRQPVSAQPAAPRLATHKAAAAEEDEEPEPEPEPEPELEPDLEPELKLETDPEPDEMLMLSDNGSDNGSDNFQELSDQEEEGCRY